MNRIKYLRKRDLDNRIDDITFHIDRYAREINAREREWRELTRLRKGLLNALEREGLT